MPTAAFIAGKSVVVFFVVGEEVLAFVDERAGAFVHNGNDRVFECGAARGRRAMHKTDTGIK
jgi:hypothetical protein